MTEEQPLAGLRIGVTAQRRAAELVGLLERKGAEVRSGPAIHTVELDDDPLLAESTTQVLAAPVDVVVAVTGVGFRGWIDHAAHRGLAERLLDRLRPATLLARGPKARGAMRGVGLPDPWTAPNETVAEVAERLRTIGVNGRRVVVQIHGEPMPELLDKLRDQGATVLPVAVYRWSDPVDPGPLDALINAATTGVLDAVTFTSAPAAANLLSRAVRIGQESAFHRAVHDGLVLACVGPVTAAPLTEAGLPVLLPDRARTGALVRTIVDQLPRRRAARRL
ncbi:uroporphyrinogen-III synthase [Actinoalloteichus hoggarensis]|uniref:Bifunctional uroporphyrinogen-III synthetase/response regulator domain protein n=1 Tax=Actinoalloteichus hoggarensis TaxID=1470176 RepID=A0A221VYH3_9PSEU|nr:uroporphyrinogen-III synthase [Actinoalloteichus hoggarensis]ASO18579.1 bifunctional uroporphyrinogen-III synthetase/response regulator domain protein [Actinoalloteichus hoggarensis]MBB5921947.1 uroporphyrinogen-III synthase [Actinoalloteichus hoggarensis]